MRMLGELVMPRPDARQAVVYYLLRVLGRPATRTEIAGMLFLVDLELARRGREPLFRWIRWHRGLLSRDVFNILVALEEHGLVVVNKVVDLWSLEIRRIEYRAAGPDEMSLPLDDETRSIVENVAKEWRNRNLRKLLSYIYDLPQVREKKLGEELVLEKE